MKSGFNGSWECHWVAWTSVPTNGLSPMSIRKLQTQRLHADSVASDLAQNAHLSQLSPAPAFEPPSPLAGPSAALAHLPPIGSTGGLPMESSTRGVKTGTSKMDGGVPVGFSLNQPEKDALHKTPK